MDNVSHASGSEFLSTFYSLIKASPLLKNLEALTRCSWKDSPSLPSLQAFAIFLYSMNLRPKSWERCRKTASFPSLFPSVVEPCSATTYSTVTHFVIWISIWSMTFILSKPWVWRRKNWFWSLFSSFMKEIVWLFKDKLPVSIKTSFKSTYRAL